MMLRSRQPRRHVRALLIATAVGWTFVDQSNATTFTWDRDENGPWHEAVRWDPDGIPGAADVAVIAIPSARPIVTYSSASGERDVGGLRVNDELRVTGGTLTLVGTRTDNRFDPNSIFRISGGVFSFKCGGTLDIDNEFHLTGGRFRTENFTSSIPAGVVQFRGAFSQNGGNIRTDGDGIVRFTNDFAGVREHSWTGGVWDGAGVGTFEIVQDAVLNIGANESNLNTLNQFVKTYGSGTVVVDGRNSGGFGGVGLVVGTLGNIENQGVLRILCDGSGVRAIEGTAGGIFSNVVNRAQGANYASFENSTGGTAPLGANLVWENRGTVNITNSGGIDYQGLWNNVSGYVTVGGPGAFRFSGGGTFAHTGYVGGSGMTLQANNTVRFGGSRSFEMQSGNLVFESGSSMIVEAGSQLNFTGATVLAPGHLIAEGGTLLLAKDGGAAGNQFGAAAARLTISSGGVVNYGQSHQVQDGTGLNINNGTINLLGFSDTIGALSMSGGARINGPGEIGLVVANGAFIQILDGVPAAASSDLSIDGQLTVQVPAFGRFDLTGATRQRVGATASGITKTGGGALHLADMNINTLLAQEGRTSLDGAGYRLHNVRFVSIPRDIVNQPTAQVDISNDALAIDYTGASPLTAVQEDIRFARNGGLWDRNGFNSVLLIPGDQRFGIGYAEAAAVISPAGGQFLGEAVDGTTVLVRYTLLGDANLSGGVDVNDFSRLAANFNRPATWATGDFTHDDFTNITDFALLAGNFNQSLPADLPRQSIPEPAALAGATFVIILLQKRNRKC